MIYRSNALCINVYNIIYNAMGYRYKRHMPESQLENPCLLVLFFFYPPQCTVLSLIS